MSLEGTAAGIAGALGLGAAAVALGLVPLAGLCADRRSRATAGSLLESWLGATLEAPGILNNDMLNFINTAIAAAVAVWPSRLDVMKNARLLLEFSRPFTLVAPALGFVSGAATALWRGAARDRGTRI